MGNQPETSLERFFSLFTGIYVHFLFHVATCKDKHVKALFKLIRDLRAAKAKSQGPAPQDSSSDSDEDADADSCMGSISGSDSESDDSDPEPNDVDDSKGPKPPSKTSKPCSSPVESTTSSGSGRSKRQIQFDQIMVEIKEFEEKLVNIYLC